MKSYEDLEGKKILITGATRGIGNSIAKNLAKQKAHVIFNYRGDEQQANILKDQLLELGAHNVSTLKFDITKTEEMSEALSLFINEFGAIEGLVNNAGIARDSLLLRMKEVDVQATLDTNLKSTIMLIQSLTKNFMRNNGGSIVNISSVVGLMGNASQVAYAASKSGIIGVTKSVAKELSSKKVRCNAICPGFIRTDMTNALNEKVKENYLNQIPLNRFGEVEEIAKLALFLLSSESAYITGETIKIDGGLYI